jgi:arsenate reductase (thioredoxin)
MNVNIYDRSVTEPIPEVLFVCVHNAGRSQMAAALLERMEKGRARVISAGSEPADQLNPAVVEAMKEIGIDISAERPKRLEDGMVRESDVVITMGCGDACPIYPGKRYEDWDLEDPADKNLETVRRIRDQIRHRVEALVKSLDDSPPSS